MSGPCRVPAYTVPPEHRCLAAHSHNIGINRILSVSGTAVTGQRRRSSPPPSPEHDAGQHVHSRGVHLPRTVLPLRPDVRAPVQLGFQLFQLERERPDAGAPGGRGRLHAARGHADGRGRPRRAARGRGGRLPDADARGSRGGRGHGNRAGRPSPSPPRRDRGQPTLRRRQRVRALMAIAAATESPRG